MKWSLTLWGMATGTSFAVFAFGFVVFFTDPSNATPFEWGLFSLTLFLALAGFCFFFCVAYLSWEDARTRSCGREFSTRMSFGDVFCGDTLSQS